MLLKANSLSTEAGSGEAAGTPTPTSLGAKPWRCCKRPGIPGGPRSPHLHSPARSRAEGTEGRVCSDRLPQPTAAAHRSAAPIDRWRIEHFSSSGEFCGFSVNRRLGPRSHRPGRGSPLLAVLTAPHPVQGAPILPGPRREDRLRGDGGGCAGQDCVHDFREPGSQPGRVVGRMGGLARESQRRGQQPLPQQSLVPVSPGTTFPNLVTQPCAAGDLTPCLGLPRVTCLASAPVTHKTCFKRGEEGRGTDRPDTGTRVSHVFIHHAAHSSPNFLQTLPPTKLHRFLIHHSSFCLPGK